MSAYTVMNRPLGVPAIPVPPCPPRRPGAKVDGGFARSNSVSRMVVHASPNGQATSFVDTIVPQGTPHDSLLKDGSTYFWDLMDKVASNDQSSDWVRGLASNVNKAPNVPLALKEQLNALASSIESLTAKLPSDLEVLVASAPGRFGEFSSSLPASLRSFASSSSSPPDPPIGGTTDSIAAGLWANLSTAAHDLWTSLQGPAMASTLTLPTPDNFNAAAGINEAFSLPGLSGGMLASLPLGQKIAVVAAVVSAMAVSSIQSSREQGLMTATDAELPTEYNQDSIYRYWSTRPVTMTKRSLQTATLAIGFLFGLAFDKQTGQEKANEKARARSLRIAIDRLGPAYIKVAQALSTRVDILSPAYFEEVTFLQDRVQPFSNEEAMTILAAELGSPISEIFSEISPSPVAAASLGQVYKATLRSSGEEVAVKVQRPGVLEMVALDLVLMRKGIEISSKLFPDLARTDGILPVLDEWATKFFREMDYRKEAATMLQFKADLAQLDGIVVPGVHEELSSRRVIVTEWINGEKLSESRAEDVRELCTTLLNAYLIQLLDTGLLHADPHPGNLLRTPDGKICILDYGLVTDVPGNLRVALLEYMAHLSMKDWTALGNDFVTLQFVTEDSVNPNEIPGLMSSVGAMMEILMAGGGATSLDPAKTRELVDMVGLDPGELDEEGFMSGFASVLDNLSNPSQADKNLTAERAAKIELLREKVKFRIPPYFVLILRAFSVIEGIALKVDPQYSIINETFPYLSRRLLTDDNEEVRKALHQVLYGNDTRMNLSRFQTLFNSVQAYTTDGLNPPQAQPSDLAITRAAPAATTSESAALDKNTIMALQSILNSSGTSYIQELLVNELAATLESLSRSAAVALLQRSLQSALTQGTLRALDRLGPLRSVLLPFPLPAEIISRLGSVVTLTEEDRVAITNVQMIWRLVQPQLSAEVGDGNLRISLLRSFSSSVQELPNATQVQLLQGANRTSQLVLQQLVRRTANRFAEDVKAYRSQQNQVNAILGTPSLRREPAGTLVRAMSAQDFKN